MFRQFKERMSHCQALEARLATHPQQVKDKLIDEMGFPAGLHTLGMPVACSLLCIVISFALPQFWIWSMIFSGAGFDEIKVFAGIVPGALAFAAFNAVTAFLIGKGFMLAVRAHVILLYVTLGVAVCFLAASLTMGNDVRGLSVCGALFSVALALAALAVVHSNAFYRMMLFALHNRAWRRVLQK